MRIGSLCSGYEGLGMAVQAVLGGEFAWVADNDPGASAILNHRFPSVPNLGDITAVDWAAVEPVDVLTAGFPCQDVSCAGGRAGLREGNRTGVWAYVARAIDELRPSLVVLENVRGLLSAGADSDMELCPWCLGEAGTEHALRACGAVLGDLADIVYDAQGAVVSAADAGAPHRRERVFIVARPAADTAATGGWWRSIPRSAEQAPQPRESRWLLSEPDDGRVGTAADAAVSGCMGGGSRHIAGSGGTPATPQRPGRLAAEHDRLACEGSSSAAHSHGPTRGEWRIAASGETEGRGSRTDAGGRGGALAADAGGAGLEVGTVEPDRDERQAAQRGSGDDAPADADSPDAGSRRGGGAAAPSARPGDGQERWSIPGSSVCGGTAADADGSGRWAEPRDDGRGWRGRLRAAGHEQGDLAWGPYEPAIRRWEAILGRPAPRPTEPGRTGERLSPAFVEWMQGLPEGWVTDVPGLSRNAQLKALGNGVVPQQAAMALRLLLDRADARPLVAADETPAEGGEAA